MEQKKGLFILGLVLGVMGSLFLVLVGALVTSTNSGEAMDVFQRIDHSIQHAKPNVIGIVNIQGGAKRGTGSGVIYKLTESEVYIVTNYHVIKDADDIEVAFRDEARAEARIIGEDLLTDLAVLAIPRGEINQSLPFAGDGELATGEFVFAIGNPLGLDLYGSITSGIVSSNHRLIPVDIDKDGEDDYIATVIQTDAAINPGNSGGALINYSGELVGINSMKIAGTHIEGLGFSIPISIVRQVIEDLETHGQVIRPYLGLHLKSLKYIEDTDKARWGLDQIAHGIYVNDVVKGSSADEAGVEVNDVITHVNKEEVKDVTDLRYKLYDYEVGAEVELTLMRAEELIHLMVPLKSRGE